MKKMKKPMKAKASLFAAQGNMPCCAMGPYPIAAEPTIPGVD